MKRVIQTANAPAAIGPYSQGMVHGDTLYISGQLPLCPGTGEMVGENVAEQARQVLENLRAIVEAAGATMEDVLKTTILLTDMGHFAAVNEVYATYFPQEPPARICYQVCALPKGALVEIDGICRLVQEQVIG